jgi:hypothetical protein
MFLVSAVCEGSYTPTEIQHVSNPTTLRKEPSRPHAVQEDLTSSSREQFARYFALITESNFVPHVILFLKIGNLSVIPSQFSEMACILRRCKPEKALSEISVLLV